MYKHTKPPSLLCPFLWLVTESALLPRSWASSLHAWLVKGLRAYQVAPFVFLQARVKVLSALVTQFDIALKLKVLSFILDDIRNRLDLAFAWLYQEYNIYLNQYPSGSIDNYDDCLIRLLSGLQEKPDQKDG